MLTWGGRRGLLSTVAVLLCLSHFAFRPALVGWLGAPDLLVGGLLLAALCLRSGSAGALGGLLGGLEGAMALEGMGVQIIVLTLVGYAAARARDLVFTDARVFLPVYLFVGVMTARLALAFVSGEWGSAPALLVAALLTAASTTLVCTVVVRVMSGLAR